MERVAKIPPHILDDLCSRFILNIPDEYKDDTIRTFFQIELAHWFYIDFYVPEDPDLKAVGIKEFANQVFRHCPFLKGAEDVASSHQDWKAYKLSVPTYGVILLDPDLRYVLLVQGFSKSWGFPKGKVNEGEDPVKCAVRELYEETGFDASGHINPQEYVEHTVGDQYSRLYIIPEVPLETHFLPQTRNEIRDMQWFPIEILPNHKKDVTHSRDVGCGPNSFFMVIPYIKQIKRWIYHKHTGIATQKSQKRENADRRAAIFAEKHLAEFQEILTTDNSESRYTEKSSRNKHLKKDSRTGSPRLHNKNRSSPQYTVLSRNSKRDEELRKVADIKRSLNLKPEDRKDISAFVEQSDIKPAKAWTNFKFDLKAIMQAALNPNAVN